jgi:hypothetical protein
MEENDELCDALQAEWCKSRAQAMWFTEEVMLFQKEMMCMLLLRVAGSLVANKGPVQRMGDNDTIKN